MHLSIHSDCFAPADASHQPGSTQSAGHFASLMRGLAVLSVALLLGSATLIADMAQQPGADAAPRLKTSSGGTAVNFMHREVIGH